MKQFDRLLSAGLGAFERALCMVTLTVVVGCATSRPVDIPVAGAVDAPRAGVGWLGRTAIDSYLRWKVFSGDRSGFVAIFARDGHVVHATTAGYEDVEAETPMRLDTRMRMASMTKPVTATAAMILVEEGKLRLEDPVSRYVPELAALVVADPVRDVGAGEPIETRAPRTELTVLHLISFQSGLGGYGDPTTQLGPRYAEVGLYPGEGSLGDRVARMSAVPLYEDPGTRWRYGWSHDVLARVIEVAAGEPYDAFLESRIFGPLGMKDTSFLPPPAGRDGMATMYTQNRHRRLSPVSDPPSDAVGWTPGGSGLVSTAPDYLRFALMLWNGGEYDGVRILRSETVERMRTPVVPSGVLGEYGIEGLGFGLGVAVVVDEDASQMIDRNGDYFWDGAYNTHFWISPSTGVVGIVMAQNFQSEYSALPTSGWIAQALAYLGLGED